MLSALWILLILAFTTQVGAKNDLFAMYERQWFGVSTPGPNSDIDWFIYGRVNTRLCIFFLSTELTNHDILELWKHDNDDFQNKGAILKSFEQGSHELLGPFCTISAFMSVHLKTDSSSGSRNFQAFHYIERQAVVATTPTMLTAAPSIETSAVIRYLYPGVDQQWILYEKVSSNPKTNVTWLIENKDGDSSLMCVHFLTATRGQGDCVSIWENHSEDPNDGHLTEMSCNLRDKPVEGPYCYRTRYMSVHYTVSFEQPENTFIRLAYYIEKRAPLVRNLYASLLERQYLTYSDYFGQNKNVTWLIIGEMNADLCLYIEYTKLFEFQGLAIWENYNEDPWNGRILITIPADFREDLGPFCTSTGYLSIHYQPASLDNNDAFKLHYYSNISKESEQLSPVVTTKTGQIKGKLIQLQTAGQDVYQFTGIPYAEPPVGELRFRKPVPKTPWNDVLEATNVTTSCYPVLVSADPTSFFTIMDRELTVLGTTQSEDCLYLNIWAPRSAVEAATMEKTASTTKKQLPVYFFFYGGGFTSGTSMFHWYNGTVLSGFDDIIVVTANYRLGSLGFAYFGKNEEAPGNAGLWDMVEALKWVSENIAAFGGNPNEVTIGGESAGGVAVSLLLLSPYSRKYFHRAISESGVATEAWASHTPAVGMAVTDALINQTCGKTTPINKQATVAEKLKCLRSVEAVTIATADALVAAVGIGVVVDGDFLPKSPSEMLASRDFHKVPLLFGSNKDEGSSALFGIPQALQMLPSVYNPTGSYDKFNFTHYTEMMKIVFAMTTGGLNDPVLFKAFLLHYWPISQKPQGGNYPEGAAILDALTTPPGDIGITCHVVNWINAASPVVAPIYAFQFSQPVPDVSKRCALNFSNCQWFDQIPPWMGAMHGIELAYVFGWPFMPLAKDWNYGRDEKLFSKMVMEYWGNFIKFGDPNVRDERNSYSLPNWPPYVGDDECQNQGVDLSVKSLIHNDGETICGLKSRDCMFLMEFFPQLADLVKQASIRHKW